MSPKSPEIDSKTLLCFSEIAALSYYLNNKNELKERSEKLEKNGYFMLEASLRPAPRWQSFKFDSFQAVCVQHEHTLIISYSGTNPKRLADLTIDSGIYNICLTPTGGKTLRQMIARQREGKTWTNWSWQLWNNLWLVAGIPIRGLAGRLIFALEYFDRQVKQMGNKYDEIITVGHSLGGFVAAHVAYRNGITAHTFDSAPGLKYSLVGHYEEIELEKANQIINHRHVDDPISGYYRNKNSPYPYGHLGWIYNWTVNADYKEKVCKGQYYNSPSCKCLEYKGLYCHDIEVLQATNFDQKYCTGAVRAPVNLKYW